MISLCCGVGKAFDVSGLTGLCGVGASGQGVLGSLSKRWSS